MEILFAIAIGAVVTASVYLFLSQDLLRILIGFILFSTGINLAILLAARIGPIQPPLVDAGSVVLAAGSGNPLPQALVLTAIVIGFGLTAFSLMLVLKAHEAMGTTSADEMEAAETLEPTAPVASPADRRKAA